MAPINKVLTNIEQDLSEEEKARARENIGAAAEGDVGSFIQAQVGDGPFSDVARMKVHIPTASASGTVSFDNGATAPLSMVKTPTQADDMKILRAHYVNNQSFFTWDTIAIGGKTITEYTIPNGATSVPNLYSDIVATVAAGKIPLIKHEVTTNPRQYSYYWPIFLGTTVLDFVRVDGGTVNVLAVTYADQVSISTSLFNGFDITSIAPEYSNTATYLMNSLVMQGNRLRRARYNISTPGAFDDTKWVPDSVSNLLGRVRNGKATVDQSLPSKWYVPNNAICHIETNLNSSGNPSNLELVVELDLDEVANFCVEMRAMYGGILTVSIVRRIPGQSPTSTTTAFYAKDAGNSLPVDKPVQITCVGTCWTMAEFVDPTAVSMLSSPQSPSSVVVENPEVT